MITSAQLLQAVKQLDRDVPINKEFFKGDSPDRTNEFLLILKPELFALEDKQQGEAFDIILSKLKSFNFHVSNARIINAPYLEKYKVISMHYGVINAVSRNLVENMTEEAKSNFKTIYGIDFKDANVHGSLELLQQNILNKSTLSDLWSKVKIERLAGGIYVGKTEFKGKEFYIINGFHPPQVDHFTDANRLIITMNVASNCKWELSRKEMTGPTYPEKASAESIRGALYKEFGNYGFNVSYVLNGIHLSAGPLEGLIELQRFNNTADEPLLSSIKNYSFGKRLLQNFDDKKVLNILSNPLVKYKNKVISLFDATEELDADDAIDLLLKVM